MALSHTEKTLAVERGGECVPWCVVACIDDSLFETLYAFCALLHVAPT